MAGRRERAVEQRDGVELTNLDTALHDELGVTKRALLDHLDALADRFVPVLAGRPLSVVRVRPGQAPFMQKNLPRGAPDWVVSTAVWAQASRRTVHHPVCDDRRTLLWLGNQRAVEFHVPLHRIDGHADGSDPSHLVLDLDPPEGSGSPDDAFPAVVAAARAVRRALADCGLVGAIKTSGAKGLHVFVPLTPGTTADDAAAATRALAVRAERIDPDTGTTAYLRADRGGKVFLDSTRSYGATVVAAYSPRARPGLPVSFPLDWDDLDDARPSRYTVHTVAELLGDTDPWRDRMPAPQVLPDELIAHGREIPVARVVAMHEGKRRRRAAEG